MNHWQANYFMAQEIAKMAAVDEQISDEQRPTRSALPSLAKTVIAQIKARLDSAPAAQDACLPLDLECA